MLQVFIVCSGVEVRGRDLRAAQTVSVWLGPSGSTGPPSGLGLAHLCLCDLWSPARPGLSSDKKHGRCISSTVTNYPGQDLPASLRGRGSKPGNPSRDWGLD